MANSSAVSLSSARITKRFRFDPACHVGTVQQTARDQELHGDLTWRGGHESARCSSNRLSAPVECSQFVAGRISTQNPPFVTQKNAYLRNMLAERQMRRQSDFRCASIGRLIGMP